RPRLRVSSTPCRRSRSPPCRRSSGCLPRRRRTAGNRPPGTRTPCASTEPPADVKWASLAHACSTALRRPPASLARLPREEADREREPDDPPRRDDPHVRPRELEERRPVERAKEGVDQMPNREDVAQGLDPLRRVRSDGKEDARDEQQGQDRRVHDRRRRIRVRY